MKAGDFRVIEIPPGKKVYNDESRTKSYIRTEDVLRALDHITERLSIPGVAVSVVAAEVADFAKTIRT